MERLIMTMPIKPQQNTNIGMYIAPTIMNTLSDIFECDNLMAINLLNTYKSKDDYLSVYKNDLNKHGIKYCDLFVDKSNIDKILMLIEKMAKEGNISTQFESIYRCECGKVDILKRGLSNNEIGKLYFLKDDRYFCRQCATECINYNESVLTLNLEEKIDDSIKIVPIFLKKDIQHLTKVFKGEKLLISKTRETGCKIDIFGKSFNIDIDFILSNYFQLFDADKKIILASNHQVLQMYLLNYLNRIVKKDDICFIANPYMNLCKDFNPLEEYEKTSDEFYKKLFILYNLKWRKKNCDWSKSVIEYISTISNTRRENLYKTILHTARKITEEKTSDDEYIEKILNQGINMQENIIESKKLVK